MTSSNGDFIYKIWNLFDYIRRPIFVMGPLLVFVSIDCRAPQKGSSGTTQGPEATQSPGPSRTAGPQGDSRVSLINAPCGNSPDLEVFISRARALHLTNLVVKLPASDWRVISRGKNLSVCAFMAAEKIEIGFFRVLTEACTTCMDEIKQDARSMAAAISANNTSVRLVAVHFEASADQTASSDGPLLSHVTGQGLAATLGSKEDPKIEPWFVVHKSGYGFFSNTSGSARDALKGDFKALAGVP